MRKGVCTVKMKFTLAVLVCFMFMPSPFQKEVFGDQGCLGCHGVEGLSMTLKNKQQLSVYVDQESLKNSVHAFLDCDGCHSGFSADKHSKKVFSTKRELSQMSSQICVQCHSSFTGIHSVMLKHKDKDVLCSDCHGAHNVMAVNKLDGDRQYCLTCHEKGLFMIQQGGEKMPIMVKHDEFEESVHKELQCSECHYGFSSEEHPERSFKSKRDFIIVSSEGCRRCHFDKYTRTLESIHYSMLAQGRNDTPVCADCHGSHAIMSGKMEKLLSAKRCKQCHDGIYDIYKSSVHGGALITGNNEDVPVCSDCHLAHDIQDPRTAKFHLLIPQVCAKCHGNEKIMSKYGLSTSVVDTYVQDFHGITLKFYKQQDAQKPIAVCTDCHGIHDIKKVTDPNSQTVKENLLERCQKCHPGATENFPDSWISHYTPTFAKAPIVYMINLMYKIFIPFMIIGLVLQILLHVWRYVVNR